MKKTLLAGLAFILSFHCSFAQLDSLQQLDEVVVKATRAREKSGLVYTQLSQKEIQKKNLGQDLPFLMNQTPSVVITSDAGTGIGYTGIRVRGSDPTRINITLNGIPFNDSESQEAYWVNLPDFSSSAQSVQIQRGVGTSTNGAGAFGATLNVNTLQLHRDPYAEVNLSGGSFNTFKTNLLASTGLLNNHFVLDLRLSKINSDGFVDRAAADLKSYYLSAGYYFKNSMIRINHFLGSEKTYQAWNGIPQALAKGDMQGLDEYISRNGYDENFKKELLERGRKYNFYQYENETDNYSQSHWQILSSLQLSPRWSFTPSLFYVDGGGYYEQFKKNGKLAEHNLEPVVVGGEVLKRMDIIRRKNLDNDFYGGIWSLNYEGNQKLKASLGGGLTQYLGGHFGEVIWTPHLAVKDFRYYENNSTKNDFNFYGKAYYNLNDHWDAYLDLQLRTVGLTMDGTGDVLQNISFDNSWTFFNPKFGLNYSLNPGAALYISYARGTKEPNRSDFIDNAPKLPLPEKLNDFEGGLKLNQSNWMGQINLYYMQYKDQLVLTGAINSTGKDIRTNVPDSYRAGIEILAGGKLGSKLSLSGNLSLSRNKIKEFTYTVPASDGTADEVTQYQNTDISFSPSVIAGGNLTYQAGKGLELSLLPKFVGKQFLDNTQSEDKMLDGYFLSDLSVSFTPQNVRLKDLNFTLLVNNLFNKQYESNGYTYSYIYGSKVTENFVFPQAGINFLAGLRIRI